MKKVRITVLETMTNERLMAEYGAPGIGPCPFHRKGEVFLSEGGGKPEGLCAEAWDAFGKYVFALASGGEGFWPEWIARRNLSVNCCNDGLRPVVFRCETVEE